MKHSTFKILISNVKQLYFTVNNNYLLSNCAIPPSEYTVEFCKDNKTKYMNEIIVDRKWRNIYYLSIFT